MQSSIKLWTFLHTYHDAQLPIATFGVSCDLVDGLNQAPAAAARLFSQLLCQPFGQLDRGEEFFLGHEFRTDLSTKSDVK
jgi:hypothetical protein